MLKSKESEDVAWTARLCPAAARHGQQRGVGLPLSLTEYLNSQFSLWQNLDFFLRIISACICGACIGAERSKRFKEAGIRTHIIVCCASALMMIISKYGFADLTSAGGLDFSGTHGADPARIAAQVVSGISFLGAGVIFKHGNTVRGLTTAAGLWATAGIGLAIGAGMYTVGIFATGMVALIQILMHIFVVRADSMNASHVQFTLQNSEQLQKQLDDYMHGQGMQILGSTISYHNDGYVTYDLLVRSPHELSIGTLNKFLQTCGTVRSVSCTPVY